MLIFSFDKFSPVYILHRKLHQMGVVFCCSAGNTFTEQPQLHPASLFVDCHCCAVIGAHSFNTYESVILPKTFLSAGCCVMDKNENNEFKQGVTIWALGENLIIPALSKTHGNEQVVNGTSVSAALVTGAMSYILPKLLNWKEALQSKFNKQNILSIKTKLLLEDCSDTFFCPKHEKQRKLIFNPERCMEVLRCKRIGSNQL